MEPLTTHCSPWFAFAFILYVAFVLYAMMNVVTATFVESTLRAAEKETKNELLLNLWKAFQRGDSNIIDQEEFESRLSTPEVTDYLKTLELSAEEAKQSHLF